MFLYSYCPVLHSRSLELYTHWKQLNLGIKSAAAVLCLVEWHLHTCSLPYSFSSPWCPVCRLFKKMIVSKSTSGWYREGLLKILIPGFLVSTFISELNPYIAVWWLTSFFFKGVSWIWPLFQLSYYISKMHIYTRFLFSLSLLDKTWC